MRPTSGITFGGRYQLQSRIAIGGMGEVWQATDLVIGRTVAIKILKDEYMGDPGFLERFRAEARHAALVNHEGIANVYDYGEEDGSAYLVMELVPGEALSAVLERERSLTPDRVLDIIAQTASALQAAHQAGLVHRDIKPGNLLITPEGRVKITDFGIARIADQVPLTATGQVMGTVQYLSPEQASGHAASPATDIYSLGIVAYECLAGRRPFTGESQVAIAMAQINDAPPELSEMIPEPVRHLVYACIAKSPQDRPASAAHLARAAQALRHGDVATAVLSVPLLAQSGGLTAETAVFGGQTAATRILPRGAAAGGAGTAAVATAAPPRRNPWMIPLIAIVAVLAVALIAILVLLAVNSSGTGPDPTASAPSGSATPSTAPTTPAPTASGIFINADDYVGQSFTDVRTALGDLGLKVVRADGGVADTPDKNGTVQDVNPTGNLNPGDEITVTVWQDYPGAPAPSRPTIDEAPPYVPISTVTVHPIAYSGCPTGRDLTGYVFTVSGVSTPEGTELGADDLSIVFGIESSGPASITYVATCQGNITTPSSPALEFTID